MTLRIGFIGAGQMAHHHLNAIRGFGAKAPGSRFPDPGSRISIAGVYDATPGKAAELAAQARARAFTSVHELLAEVQPDVVHICTPPAAHFDAARAALDAGAHVYVEKPFAMTSDDARALLALARRRGRLVCAGHQLLCDPAFAGLMNGITDLGSPVQVDSTFAFRPADATARHGDRALARLLIDILPHPLYTLVAALERLAPNGEPVELDAAVAGPSDVQALLRAGSLTGRLSVSLRARPVASFLTVMGSGGSRTCDFVRSMVTGAGNPGTEALEKVFNPMLEGAQLVARTTASVARRVSSGIDYPGLAELIERFYASIARGGASPVSPAHLMRVTEIFEDLVGRIEAAVPRRPVPVRPPAPSVFTPGLVVVTGARGMLGSAIARKLSWVREIVRNADAGDKPTPTRVVADLGAGLAPSALAGADVVVHAAAETAGGYDAHQRNTIDATRHLLHAMRDAGVSRLVLVSSLSVIRPPRWAWERQDERTPRPKDSKRFGAYTWGKCEQEALVEREAAALGIATRIIRPGALIDWHDPSLPGLMGRRLFGRWHLGMGAPRLPIAVCGVERCADAIAWCAAHFDDAPPIVNLLEPETATRGRLVARLRADGWSGRMVWVPISVIAMGLMTVRTLLALGRGRRPEPLAAWSILRPRRYDARVAATLLDSTRRTTATSRAEPAAHHASLAPSVVPAARSVRSGVVSC